MTTTNKILPPLALLHNEDTYYLFLLEVSPKQLRLADIHRYAGNQNVEAVAMSWRDLDQRCRDACVQQVNRKYPGRSLLIS